MKTMVSVTEAQNLILDHIRPNNVSVVPLQSALGAVLAAPVRASVDVPAFDNSAMDGFALAHSVANMACPEQPVVLPIAGFQPAGSPCYGTLQPGRALRIATGAMIPMDATAVVPIENVEERDGMIVIQSPVKKSAHIRFRGEETVCGEEVLGAGIVVSPGVIGYLASIGVTEIPIYCRPRVGIVATGTELRSLGSGLDPGQIFDSNSLALASAMRVDGVVVRVYPPVEDDPELLKNALSKVILENDLTVVSGGVSVGEKDYIKDIMTQLGFEPLFWGVRQKPGKPLFVGSRWAGLFFGLPGNPASALINYYEYVRPALRKMMGYAHCALPSIAAKLITPISKRDQKTHFIRATLEILDGFYQVHARERQGSHSMRSFAQCNALIVVPEEVECVAKGEVVTVHVLPQGI